MTAYSSESFSSVLGTTPAASNWVPLWISRVASPPSSSSMFGPWPSGQVSICSVHHQYSGSVSPFQAKTATPWGSSTRAVRADDGRRGGVVLGGEDVAGDPPDVGAQRRERLDEHGGLHGHVQRAGDARALERLLRTELLAQLHQAGHLVLGEADLVAAELGEPEVLDLVGELLVSASHAGFTPQVGMRSARGVQVRGRRCGRWQTRGTTTRAHAGARQPTRTAVLCPGAAPPGLPSVTPMTSAADSSVSSLRRPAERDQRPSAGDTPACPGGRSLDEGPVARLAVSMSGSR